MPPSRRNAIIALCLAVACLIAAGPAWAGPLILTAKDSGKTLTVAVGQRLRVDLHLGAGQHLVAPEFDPMVLTLLGQSLQSTSGPQGAFSRVVYDFLVRQGGQTELAVSSKGSGNQGPADPLLKVKIIAIGGGLGI
jgi:hypothetical protein|uniref:AMIN domain-containing protein n=1 Tax=Desulfobacca acetoxidans TaxID=60893 RepID=A0A7C3V9R5_9BACT